MDDVKPELRFVYQSLAAVYARQGDYSNAFRYQTLNTNLKDTLYNIESKKQLNQLQFDFELEKKEAELKLQDEKLRNEKQARTGITITVVILLLGALIIYRGYLQKLKINRILDGQIAQNEALLLNILPKEIANELKTAGKTQPNHYDEVSVLFTDIVQFTTIADKMTPSYVVEELNRCFTAFDNIIEKHCLEKIKTIGDAYMCAGNIPSPLPNHTFIMVKAALDMVEFLKGWNESQLQQGKPVWEVRIGIHLGPLVAGVVGRKKYAYDIWGSTVNIASRMESACPPGEINISQDVYDKVKDQVECAYRGKIIVKNLGELDMYLVKGLKNGA
jgi:class 3 adenylate cyclase